MQHTNPRSLHWTCPLFLLLAPGAIGQNSYSFEQATATYTDITGASPLAPDVQGADVFNELDGETFWFYGLPFTFDENHLIYAFDIGYLIVQNDSSVVAIDGVNQPLHPVDASSTVTYAISGTPGDKVLTVQWKNWLLADGPDDNYANWQIAIHQSSGVVEVHYGPNSGSEVVYTDATGPFCGITYMPTDFSTCYEKLWVEHNTFDIVLDSVPNFDFDALHNMPTPNTVFRFTPRFLLTGIHGIGSGDTGMHARLSAEGEELLITLDPSSSGTLTLLDASGRALGERAVSGATMNWSLRELGKGTYLLVHTAGGQRSVVRFVR